MSNNDIYLTLITRDNDCYVFIRIYMPGDIIGQKCPLKSLAYN